jgi:hypothetical protein
MLAGILPLLSESAMGDFRKFLEGFLRVAMRFRSPLAVTGVSLLAVYALVSKILTSVRFQPLTSQGSYSIVRLILDQVFLIALVAIVLSIAAYIVPKIIPKSAFAPTPRVDYALAVFRMFDPSDDPAANLFRTLEPYPGFPFYSRESNHSSAWPQRVWTDRQKLSQEQDAFYLDPVLQAALKNDKSFNPRSSQVFGGGPLPDEEREGQNLLLSTRIHLYHLFSNGGPDAINQLGPFAERFVRVERGREALRQEFPNRIAIVRLKSTGRVDVPNLGVEFEIAGSLYDCRIDADPAKVLQSSWDYAAQRIRFDRLPRDYTAEIRLYYQYQSLSERVFPDKINFIQELTQGIRIANITASRTEVRFDPALLDQVAGIERMYLGDARKKDSYEPELAAQQEKLGEQMVASMKRYQESHPTLKDLPLDRLNTLDIPQEQMDNVWVSWRSPAGRSYTGVHVFTHVSGSSVLLSSRDRDREDFTRVAEDVAAGWHTSVTEPISDRQDDICMSIQVKDGFTAKAIFAACEQLTQKGYSGFRVANVYYHTGAA